MSQLLAAVRVVLVFLLLIVLIPLALLCHIAGMQGLKHRIVQCFYRCQCYICGIHIEVEGSIAPLTPLLLVPNHTTYLDVLVLGGLAPMVFTPKAEIARWPLIGAISRLCDVVFIERRSSKIKEAHQAIAEKITRGARVCLFPEGTTSDGVRLLPFKTSFFEMAVGNSAVSIQPVSIVYSKMGGLPIFHGQRSEIAWVGDADFLSHVWNILGKQSITARILFHPIMQPMQDRKSLARECQKMVQQGCHQLRNTA